MKSISILFLITLMILSFTGSGQTEKGSFLVGGDAWFNSAFASSRTPNLSLFLSPTAGLFIANNFAIGAGIGTGFSISNSFSSINYGISPFVRVYFGESKTKPFLLGEIGYRGATYFTLSSSSNSFSGRLGIGLASFINSKVAIETVLGYRVNAGIGTPPLHYVNLSVGFQIYLPAKKKE